MFCKNCGHEIKEGAAFCPNCGNKLEKKGNIPSYRYGQINNAKSVNRLKKKKMSPKKKKKFKIIAGITGVIIVAAIIAISVYNMDYKHVVNAYIKEDLSGDENSAEKEYKLLSKETKEAMLNEYKEDNEGADEKEMLEESQKTLDNMMDALETEYGENWKYSFEIKKVEDASRKEIREWKQDIKDAKVKFNREVRGMKKVTVKLRLQSEDGKKNDKTDMDITVVRLGRKWYIGKTGL